MVLRGILGKMARICRMLLCLWAITLPFQAFAQSEDVLSLLQSGWQAYERKDLRQAIQDYQQVLNRVPQDARLWYDLGCLYTLNHDLANAQQSWNQALALNPRSAQVHDALGQLLEQQADGSGAQIHYATATELEPGNAAYLWHRIRNRLYLKKFSEARSDLQRLLMLDPNHVEGHYALGVLTLQNNAPDLAILEFRKTIDLAPNHVLALNGLGLAYIRIREFEQAAEVLQKADRLDPWNARTESNLGILAASQQQWEKARQAWEQALKESPQFEPASRNLKILDGLMK